MRTLVTSGRLLPKTVVTMGVIFTRYIYIEYIKMLYFVAELRDLPYVIT